MFGELIGLWAAAVWQLMGAPGTCALVELGPGRGTLMADALRAAKVVPAFPRRALVVHLVEISPALRAAAASRRWRMRDVPIAVASVASTRCRTGPPSSIANEFFDALPVHQAVKQRDGWHERVVEIGAGRQARLRPRPRADPAVRPARCRAQLRDAPDRRDLRMARRQHRARARPAARARRRRGAGHRLRPRATAPSATRCRRCAATPIADPLAAPGEADLTAHVDFAALARARREHGRARVTARSSRATSCAASASRRAPRRSRRCARRRRPPTSTPRWRA